MASSRTQSKRLRLKGERIPYTVRQSRRTRRVSLTMHYDGSFIVSAPENANFSQIERFIKEKSAWILRNFLYFKNFRGKIFTGDKKEFLAHKERALQFIARRLAYFSAGTPRQRRGSAEWRAEGCKSSSEGNGARTFRVNRVTVKLHRAQWGSCSDKRNLNFNYKILFLPPRLADYVIVHELCHTRELNHSSRFWRLVGEFIPSYARYERELRNYRIG